MRFLGTSAPFFDVLFCVCDPCWSLKRMGVLERSQLSASALLIVRATLWLLPGFISRHFIEGRLAQPNKLAISRIAGIHIPALH